MLIGGRFQLRGTARWTWRKVRRALRHSRREIRQLPIVFGNAMPKSGSKLLFNILRGLEQVGPFVDTGLKEIKPFEGGLPTPQSYINTQLDRLGAGDIRFGYLPWNPETEARLCREGWATYLILRDPRDTLVSAIYYAMDMHEGHALHGLLRSLPDMEARIDTMIRGIPEGPLRRVGVRQQYDRYLPWVDRPGVCLIRYEHLVQDPDRSVGDILRHLKARGFAAAGTDEASRRRLREQMAPERSETFRKGGSGGWRQHFTEGNRKHFREAAGDLLQVLGYEA